MKIFIVLAVICIIAVNGVSRSKREAFELPDGVSLLLSDDVDRTFVCKNNGYYADVENNCQIFHVCYIEENEDGTSQTRHWSFVCGNQTVFNQLTLTCAYPEVAVPCAQARDFFPLNDKLFSGDSTLPFLTNEDIARAYP